jgi:hypothetical protein
MTERLLIIPECPNFARLVAARLAASRSAKPTRTQKCRYRSDSDRLADDPRPLGAFPYGSADLLRIRVGRYRILYEIDPEAQSIAILHVGRIA